MVTLSSHTDVRAYPCRTREQDLELATRFIAGLSRRSPQAEAGITKDVAQPKPAK